jgi:hypothetical protein
MLVSFIIRLPILLPGSCHAVNRLDAVRRRLVRALRGQHHRDDSPIGGLAPDTDLSIVPLDETTDGGQASPAAPAR